MNNENPESKRKRCDLMATGKVTIRTRSGGTRKQGDTSSWKSPSPKTSGSPSSGSPGPKKTVSLKEASTGHAARTTPARDVIGREVKPVSVSLKVARGRTPTGALSLPSLREQQAAAKIVGVDPKLAVHLTKYDVSNILGTRSMTVKSPEARGMYTSILRGREKRGVTPRVTASQQAAIARQEAQALREARKPYTPIISKTGEVIPRFDIKRYTDKQAKGVYGPGWYLSVEAVRKAENVNRYANKPITQRTNDLEKRKIIGARKLILDQQVDKKTASEYFQRIDRGTAKFEVPTKKEISYVKSELKKAIIAELAGTKYTQAQKEAIADTKLNRTPVREDLKRDWIKLDNRLSKLLNLPTEKEIIAHRDRTFGKIPGFTKWQADFAKRMDKERFVYGVNLSVEKGFKDFSFNEYRRLKDKPATYGAELAAMFIGGEILGAVTKGGAVITKAALTKSAARSTKPMVKAGLLKGAKHLDKMVAAGFIAPLVAQGIAASWEDKFKLGKGVLVGGAGFSKGSKMIGRRLAGIEPATATSTTPGRIESVTKKALSKEGFEAFMKNEKADISYTPVHSIKAVTPEGKAEIKFEYYEVRDGKGKMLGKQFIGKESKIFIKASEFEVRAKNEGIKIVETGIENGKPVKKAQRSYKRGLYGEGVGLFADKTGVKVKKLTQSQKMASRRESVKKIKAEAPKIEKLTPAQIRKTAKENNLDVIVEREIEMVEVGTTGDPYKDFEAVERYVAVDSAGKVLSKDIEKFPLDLKKFAGDSVKVAEVQSRQGQVLIQKQKILPVSEAQPKVKLKVTSKSIQKIRARMLEEVKQPEKIKIEEIFIGKKKTVSQKIARSKIKTKAEIKSKVSQIKNVKVKSDIKEYADIAPIETTAQRVKAIELVDQAVETETVPKEVHRELIKETAKSAIKTKQELKIKTAQIQNTRVKNKIIEYIKLVPLSTVAQRVDALESVDQTIKTGAIPTEVASLVTELKEVPEEVVASIIESIGKNEEIAKEAIDEAMKETPKRMPPKRSPPKQKPKEELPPVIPPLPAWKRKKLTKKQAEEEARIVNTMSRTIKNQLGDIESILG